MAQVSAAVVGVIGAVLSNQIIQYATPHETRRAAARQRLREFCTAVDNARDRIRVYRDYLERAISENEGILKAGGKVRLETSWTTLGGGGSMTPGRQVDAAGDLKEKRAALEALQKVVADIPAKPVAGRITRKSLEAEVSARQQVLARLKGQDDLRSMVNGEIQQLALLGVAVREVRRPGTLVQFTVTILALAGIALASIWMPLTHLPALEESDLALMVGGILAGIAVVLLVFLGRVIGWAWDAWNVRWGLLL